MKLNEAIKKYLALNEEEKIILKIINETGEKAYINDACQDVDASTYLHATPFLIKKHPRFSYIAEHKHNYLEINYVLSGEVKQTINGKKVKLHSGDLLFMGKNSIHSIEPCSEKDIVINFIILPTFFDFIFSFIKNNSFVKTFLLNIAGNNNSDQTLLFRVGDNEQIQNIIENILLDYEEDDNLKNDTLKLSFATLIFELMKKFDKVETVGSVTYESSIMLKVQDYVDNNYKSASLKELCDILDEDYSYISKKIKKLANKTFKELVEDKRVSVACELLTTTTMVIDDIAYFIGYCNLSFFYRLFKEKTGLAPRQYRLINSNHSTE